MPLKKTNVSFPFSGGLDEKISEKIAPPGTLEIAENCQFDKNGEIVKRKGFETMWAQTTNWDDNTPLDSNVEIAGGANTESHGNELLIADGERLFSYFDGYVKNKGKYLNCTFHNKDIIQDEVEKNGPIQHTRFETDAGDEYDLFVYTATRPVGKTANQEPFVKAYYSIYSVDTGEPIVNPTEFASISRKNPASIEATSVTPAPQLMYIEALDTAFILYGDYNSGAIKYYYRTIRLDSVSNFAISAATEITAMTDPSGTAAPTPVQSFFCMVADAVTSTTVTQNFIYMAYYEQVGGKANDSGDLILLRLQCGGTALAPSLNLLTIKDVTGGVYGGGGTNNSQTNNLYQKFGTKVNLSLRYTGNTARPLSLFYSVQDSSTVGNYRVKCSSFTADLSTQTDITYTDDYYVLLNATAIMAKRTSATDVNEIVINAVKDRNNNSSIFDAASGFKTFSGGSGDVQGTGFIEGIYDMPSSPGFGITPAKVYIPAAAGITPHDSSQLTVLDGGNNLQSNFSYTITSPTGGTDAEYRFDSIGAPEKTRQADSVILMHSHTMSSTGSLTTTPAFRNCYLLSDLFHYEFNELTGSKLLKDPYFLISNPLGVGQTNSGTTALVSFSRDLLAFGLPSEMPLSAHTEINSMEDNKFSLTQSTQRVQIKGSKILIGSTRFVRDVSTTDVAETGLGNSNVVYDDQIYNGTLITIDADPARACPMLSLKDNLLLGGGGLFSYDSTKIVESDFLHSPEFIDVQKYGLAGGVYTSNGIAEGDYSYAAVFSAIDNKGNLHESAPVFSDSINISATDASNKTGIHVRIAVCNLTARDRYRVDVYRTDADGQIYYQIAGDIVRFDQPNNRQTEFVFNDNGTGGESITERPVLYSTGGIAQNFNPGSTTGLTLHKDKVIATLPNGFAAVSKPTLVGESVSFPLVGPFVLNLGNVVKEITAAGSARDMLVIFTEDDVYAYMGDGPNATGAIGFTQPKLLSSGQGAIPGSFVVSSSAGMYYLSERGLYSILSNGQIQYISPQVESKLAPKAVVGMDMFDEQNELRIALSTGDILVYNYLFKRWSEWNTNIGIKSQTRYQPDSGSSVTSHVLVNGSGSPAKMSVNGFRDTEVAKSFSPPGTIIVLTASYTMKVRTTPISANQLFGAQRVYRAMILGDYVSSHTATLFVYTDYKSVPSTYGIISVASAADPYLYRIHLKQQKCRAVQLEFSDGSANGGAVVLNGIAFEIGGRPDTFKLPNTQTVQGL